METTKWQTRRVRTFRVFVEVDEPTLTKERCVISVGSALSPLLRSPRRTLAALVIASSTALAACGSTTAAASDGGSSLAGSAASNRSGPSFAPVSVVLSDVTAQMLAAAPRGSSEDHEARFTLRALTRSGR
jgi:hypothetical protein